MEKPTKYYSMKQEKLIADYFGWKTVAASGARPFCPGDVKSSGWLAECKTHTKLVDRIEIVKSVWAKICNEARSKYLKPVLFVDNGTQSISNTWAIISKQHGPIAPTIQEFVYKNSQNKITFNHAEAANCIKNQIAEVCCDGRDIYLMRAEVFKEYLNEE